MIFFGIIKAKLILLGKQASLTNKVLLRLADLNNVPWLIIENEEDIDDAVFIWNQLFSEIADLHAPVKRRRIRGVPLPWLNDKISEVMKDRDFHHRKAVKTNSAFHCARYRKLRNRVNREVKAAKSKYYCDLILEAKGDSGKIWKAVNEVSSRKTKSSSPQCIELMVLNTPLQPLLHPCSTVISHPLAEVLQIKYQLLLCSQSDRPRNYSLSRSTKLIRKQYSSIYFL